MDCFKLLPKITQCTLLDLPPSAAAEASAKFAACCVSMGPLYAAAEASGSVAGSAVSACSIFFKEPMACFNCITHRGAADGSRIGSPSLSSDEKLHFANTPNFARQVSGTRASSGPEIGLWRNSNFLLTQSSILFTRTVCKLRVMAAPAGVFSSAFANIQSRAVFMHCVSPSSSGRALVARPRVTSSNLVARSRAISFGQEGAAFNCSQIGSKSFFASLTKRLFVRYSWIRPDTAHKRRRFSPASISS
mmetsp:Transcript_27005/g.68055  ORF Transcript_27005/g.68055 Transcript_27005/m.68055 type:complete len:248 (+) Transcript_27005:453-1196(+)